MWLLSWTMFAIRAATGEQFVGVFAAIGGLLCFTRVLAQVPDPLTGGLASGGWASAGLLGMVLGWLLIIHLPAKDKQIKELVESKDVLVQGITEKHGSVVKDAFGKMQAIGEGKDKQIQGILEQQWTTVQTMTKDHKEVIRETAATHKEEMARVTDYFQRQTSNIVTALQDLSEKVDERSSGGNHQREPSKPGERTV